MEAARTAVADAGAAVDAAKREVTEREAEIAQTAASVASGEGGGAACQVDPKGIAEQLELPRDALPIDGEAKAVLQAAIALLEAQAQTSRDAAVAAEATDAATGVGAGGEGEPRVRRRFTFTRACPRAREAARRQAKRAQRR